jgi:hypothetical protein
MADKPGLIISATGKEREVSVAISYVDEHAKAFGASCVGCGFRTSEGMSTVVSPATRDTSRADTQSGISLGLVHR